VARQGDHQGGLGAAVDLARGAAAGVLAGLVREARHAHVEGEAGLGAEALQRADLAGQLGAGDRAEAGDRVDAAGQLGAFGDRRTGLFQGVDLRQQLQDVTGVGHDHRPHVGHLRGKLGTRLPRAEEAGVLDADPADLHQAPRLHPRQLREGIPAGEQAQGGCPRPR
jgi:hypothetical protein